MATLVPFLKVSAGGEISHPSMTEKDWVSQYFLFVAIGKNANSDVLKSTSQQADTLRQSFSIHLTLITASEGICASFEYLDIH
jgi:hypothetical protein